MTLDNPGYGDAPESPRYDKSGNESFVEALNTAIGLAWGKYRLSGDRYREGFADGLEAAMTLLERVDPTDYREPV